MNSHQCDVVGMSCQVGCLVQDTHAILGSSCTHGAVPAFLFFCFALYSPVSMYHIEINIH